MTGVLRRDTVSLESEATIGPKYHLPFYDLVTQKKTWFAEIKSSGPSLVNIILIGCDLSLPVFFCLGGLVDSNGKTGKPWKN